MMKNLFAILSLFIAASLLGAEEATLIKGETTVIPSAIPGTPRDRNNNTASGYASPSVKAELKINVKDDVQQVLFTQDNTDPYVITKAYKLKNADPYSARGYLESVVNAKRVNSSPVQVASLKYKDGTAFLLVSAEDYRFKDSANGEGIDTIVAKLDKKDLSFNKDCETYIYFPKVNSAANLMSLLKVVGSNELDPEFAISPDKMMVDAELNALLISAPEWSYRNIKEMLDKYDVPMPEIRISYRVLEVYAENDDRIGVDFQSWKNNDGVDLFSAGARIRRNWSSFYTGGLDQNGNNNLSYWNFNPKWNTRYLDFLTSIGKAKILTSGELLAKNRESSKITVNYGYFCERTDFSTTYLDGEFAYTDPNPDVIQRQPLSKILPASHLTDFLPSAVVSGFYPRMLGYLDGGLKYTVPTTASAEEQAIGQIINGTFQNHNPASSDGEAGIVHGKLQYPYAEQGFLFDLKVRPVVTSKAAKINFQGNTISLLGWNSDGSPRTSESKIATTFQADYSGGEFVIGGLKRSEAVRSVAGLPFFKDIPVLGLLFSTENESIKQSQLVIVAKVEFSRPGTTGNSTKITENIGRIVDKVNTGVDSKVGNMFFQQYGIDTKEIK